jgi:Flp pilus assembly protein TadD
MTKAMERSKYLQESSLSLKAGYWKLDCWRAGCCVVGSAGLIVLLTAPAWAVNAKRKPTRPGSAFRNAAPAVRYVGSTMCKGCHLTIYEEFSGTEMGRSTSLPIRLLDSGWLSQPVDIFNEKHNRHYQVFARGAKVYESEYGVDGQGNETFRHTEELAYVVGTGANGATPVVRRGNYLFQAPVSYYTARKAWGLSPNYEVRDLGFSLPVTADCIGCHAGRTQPVEGREKEGLYRDPPLLELAISCETCHGPGELHVNERLAGKPVPGKIDLSIVNPAKLSPWLADNICMTCHEGDIRALQPGKTEADFRPGTPLNHTVAILRAPIDPQSTESPLLEHYYSMTLSKCYRGRGGRLSCENCHDPHLQPSEQEAPAYFRAKCLQCHTEKSCTLDLQTRLAQPAADACSTCHMQRQPALTVSHSTLTNHRILRQPDEGYPDNAFQGAPDTGFIHVNAVPGENSRIPPVTLLRAYRQELIRGHLEYKDHYFSLLDRLTKANNKDSFVLSAIAQKAQSDGDLNQAVSYATQVIDQGSTSTYDYLLLDSLLARTGDIAGSINLLKKGISISPYEQSFYENLAVRQLSNGDTAGGVATIERGLELFPEDSVLRQMQEQAVAQGLVH